MNPVVVTAFHFTFYFTLLMSDRHSVTVVYLYIFAGIRIPTRHPHRDKRLTIIYASENGRGYHFFFFDQREVIQDTEEPCTLFNL